MALVERDIILDSQSDINNLIRFFSDFENLDDFTYSYVEYSSQLTFRYIILICKEIFNQSTLTILGYFSFLTSSIFCYLIISQIRSRKYLLYIFLLLLMVLFTPRVINLFVHGPRSGIAFTILILAIMYLKGVKQYVLFALSTMIHLSMLPFISLYFLYYFFKYRIKKKFLTSLFILIVCTSFFAMIAPIFYYSSGVNQSIYYMSAVFYVGLLTIFTNKDGIKNIYGFMSAGLVLIIFFGYTIDFSFIRYIGNSIVLYFLFLVKEGELRNIQVFTIGYVPFFLLTSYYSIANYW